MQIKNIFMTFFELSTEELTELSNLKIKDISNISKAILILREDYSDNDCSAHIAATFILKDILNPMN